VSLTVATREDHVPIDFELYLPESWLSDARRAQAGIPDDVQFKTKLQLVLPPAPADGVATRFSDVHRPSRRVSSSG
jgi:hypothetical protein